MEPPTMSAFDEIASSEFEDDCPAATSPRDRDDLGSSGSTSDNDSDDNLDDKIAAYQESLVQAAREAVMDASAIAVVDFGKRLMKANSSRGYRIEAFLSLRGERARVVLDATQMVRRHDHDLHSRILTRPRAVARLLPS